MKNDVLLNGARRSVELTRSAEEPSHLLATIDDRRVEADAAKISPGVYSILLGGRSLEVRFEALVDGMLVRTAGREYRVEIVDLRSWRRSRSGRIDLAGRQQIAAPMAGKVVRILVAPGQENAERNSLAKNGDGRAAARQGRSGRQFWRNSRRDRVGSRFLKAHHFKWIKNLAIR
jgi:biotin carboxyl carrier protein